MTASLGARPLPALRPLVLLVAGAMPVLSISLFVFGVLPMSESAPLLVAPLALAAAVIVVRESPEGIAAARGFGAGLVAVTAYDAVRVPLVVLRIWPDFIPRIGGWVTGSGHDEIVIGYLWRYVGDGGGIGLAWFVVCSLQPSLVRGREGLASIGYGVFVWSGLIATVALAPQGEHLLFRLTPLTLGLSLLGHLIYGGVLGLLLRRSTSRDEAAPARPHEWESTPRVSLHRWRLEPTASGVEPEVSRIASHRLGVPEQVVDPAREDTASPSVFRPPRR